jgi:hypothetical protein
MAGLNKAFICTPTRCSCSQGAHILNAMHAVTCIPAPLGQLTCYIITVDPTPLSPVRARKAGTGHLSGYRCRSLGYLLRLPDLLIRSSIPPDPAHTNICLSRSRTARKAQARTTLLSSENGATHPSGQTLPYECIARFVWMPATCVHTCCMALRLDLVYSLLLPMLSLITTTTKPVCPDLATLWS